MPRLIDANALKVKAFAETETGEGVVYVQDIDEAPTVKAYTAHEVAEIIAELFGDTCACNFNRIDEWLPEKCELLDACPDSVGVACWEQWLKHRNAKMDGDGNGT